MNATRRRLLSLGQRQGRRRAHLRDTFDVRLFGAVGNRTADDTAAINRAIAAAAINEGTVSFLAGTHRSYSIGLKSFVALSLGEGATIVAGREVRDFPLSASHGVPDALLGVLARTDLIPMRQVHPRRTEPTPSWRAMTWV